MTPGHDRTFASTQGPWQNAVVLKANPGDRILEPA
jgi:hypothetical protein